MSEFVLAPGCFWRSAILALSVFAALVILSVWAWTTAWVWST